MVYHCGISNPSPNFILKHFVFVRTPIGSSSNQRRWLISLRTYTHFEMSCIISFCVTFSPHSHSVYSQCACDLSTVTSGRREGTVLARRGADAAAETRWLCAQEDRPPMRAEAMQRRRKRGPRISLPCVSPCRQTKHSNTLLK